MPRKSTKKLFRRGKAQKFNKIQAAKPIKRISHTQTERPYNYLYLLIIILAGFWVSLILYPKLIEIIKVNLISLLQADFNFYIELPKILLPEIKLPQIRIPSININLLEIIKLQAKAINSLLLSTQAFIVNLFIYAAEVLNPVPALKYVIRINVLLHKINILQINWIFNFIGKTFIALNPLPLVIECLNLVISGLELLIQLVTKLMNIANPFPSVNKIIKIEIEVINNFFSFVSDIFSQITITILTIFNWFYGIFFNAKEFTSQKLNLVWLKTFEVLEIFSPLVDYTKRIFATTLNGFGNSAHSLNSLLSSVIK